MHIAKGTVEIFAPIANPKNIQYHELKSQLVFLKNKKTGIV